MFRALDAQALAAQRHPRQGADLGDVQRVDSRLLQGPGDVQNDGCVERQQDLTLEARQDQWPVRRQAIRHDRDVGMRPERDLRLERTSDHGRAEAQILDRIHAVAVRDAEDRARFIGYRVEYYKLWIFVCSAVIAGIAGALYVPQVGIINPGEFSPLNSIELVVWVAVGGRATLYGAALGAILVNYSKTFLTGALPEVWLFALGGLFIFVTLFLPKGIIGLIDKLKKKKPVDPS